MLTRVADGPALVVCDTCRHRAGERTDESGVSGGARLAEALRAAHDADPLLAGIAIQPMPCLFACQHHCAVHLRAPGKIGYVLGGFAPDAAAAEAILAYARAYCASADGRVAYSEWPEGVKGHFLVRIPPAGFVAE